MPGNRHTAKWLIDGTSVNGVVTEPVDNKNGKVTGSYKFNTPGVYKLQMNITDQKGITTTANSNGDLEAIVVIYDPNGGYTYGGGYYSSPAGAFKQNPAVTGDVSYGFTINYYKNATFPKGETQFSFKLDEFEFNAVNFEYLAINNAMAQFKGTGKITGGQSGIGFTMTVIDGELDGTGIDKMRMKIYNKNTGAVIYDNQPGSGDAELPTVAVGANSTIVISGGGSSTTIVAREEQSSGNIAAKDLDLRVYPNPSTDHFILKVNSNNKKEKISLMVVDQMGRVIERHSGVQAGAIVRIGGEQYKPGAYYVKVIQGKEAREIKLIKLSE